MGSIEEIMQVCRLCLVKEQVNIPIFAEETESEQRVRKINSCLPVKVNQNDNLPKKICDGCSYKLDMMFLFRNTSVNSEKQLIQWLSDAGVSASSLPQSSVKDNLAKSEISVKQETFDNSEVNDLGTDAHTYIMQQQKLPYQQNFAFAEASSSASTAKDEAPTPRKRPRRAAAAATVSKKKDIETDEEDEDDDLDAAMQITKAEDDDSDEDRTDFVEAPSTSADDQPGPSGVGAGTTEAPFTDMVKRENSERRSKKKSKKSLKEQLSCPQCQRIFKRTSSLAKHMLIHTEDRPYSCDRCPKSFRSQYEVIRHAARVHAENPKTFECDLCGMKLKTKQSLEIHQRRHLKQYAQTCLKCNLGFITNIEYNRHMFMKHNEGNMKLFQCEFCGRKCASAADLRIHRESRHWEVLDEEVNKYKCHICNLEYSSMAALRRHHSSKHDDNISLLCDTCGKRLSSKEQLKFHIRIHTGYKPHACEMCPKSFSRKERLIEHQRVHTGEKPYICQYCNKGFTQRTPLRIHERTHTGERPYICKICQRGYISKGAVDTHMKSCGINMASLG